MINKIKKINLGKVTAFVGRLGKQRHLAALRDAFATYLPFLVAGAFGMLMITVVFGGWDSEQNSLLGLISKADKGHFELKGNYAKVSEAAVKIFQILPAATFDSISVYIAMFVPWFLTKSRLAKEKDQDLRSMSLMAVGISVFTFLGYTGLDTSWFGANGLLPAIIISIVATELFLYMSQFKKIQIRMPNSVPPAVARAFSKLGAVILTALILALFNYIFVAISQFGHWDITEAQKTIKPLDDVNKLFTEKGLPAITDGQSNLSTEQYNAFMGSFTDYDVSSVKDFTFDVKNSNVVIGYEHIKYAAGSWGFFGFIYQILTSPLMVLTKGTTGGLTLALLYVFLVGLLWFFGLHGANMMSGIFSPLWFSALAFNVLAIKNHVDPEYVFAQPFFEGFIWVGGGMGTLMLITASLIFSKRPEQRDVAKFALVPGIFNINEPVVFGYPIVLEWKWFIPFVFVMPIQVIITWLFMGPLGIVAKPTIALPWTTPPILGSLIVTKFDWHAIFPALINLAISFGIYVPFVLFDNRTVKAQTKKEVKKVKNGK